MTDYITEIQSKLITEYGFQNGENGCPASVPDGAYPMIIDKDLDMVVVIGCKIWCCNFISKKGGLKEFQAEARNRYSENAIR